MKGLILFFIVCFTISQSYGSDCSEDPCSKYQQPCVSDEECGEKYFNCLEPKASTPNLLKIHVCEKEGKENIQLELAEWKNKPGKNQLLCSFFEDDFLMQFATSVKHTCKAGLMSRKKELEEAGYSCTLVEESSTDQQATPDTSSTPENSTDGDDTDTSSTPENPTDGDDTDATSTPENPTDGDDTDTSSTPENPTDGDNTDSSATENIEKPCM